MTIHPELTPKKLLYSSDDEEGKILNYEAKINGKYISPFTSDESSDHHKNSRNKCRNSYRTSISTNNTLNSPQSKEMMNEIIYNSNNHEIDIEKSYIDADNEGYLLINNQEKNKLLSNKNTLNRNIDELVIQRLNNSKRRKSKRLSSTSSNVLATKIEGQIDMGPDIDVTQKSLLKLNCNKANTNINTLSYQNTNGNNNFKCTSLIDTNSKEFNSMPQSMQKKVLQMIRNRQSAQKHRDKQKIERQNLIQENIALRARIAELSRELQELRAKQATMLEQEGAISQVKNGYRFTNYNMNNQFGNFGCTFINGKRNEHNTDNNAHGNEDSEINHLIIKEKNKSKINNINLVGAKNQDIDCGFDFVPNDEFSNIGVWNPICDTNGNVNMARNASICNQINLHPNIDVLPWIGAGPVVTWNKPTNYVEDMLISNK
ncbi:transcription factor [Cryptosporidium felis]|nr:transcription factor [Cryptosporidium felis]